LRHEISTLLPFPSESNPGAAAPEHSVAKAAATIINGMRARIIGRALGIGVRVVGRIAGQRIAAQTQPSGQSVAPLGIGTSRAAAAQLSEAAIRSRAAGQVAGQIANQAGRGVSQGVGGILRPFRRVGGILWLEVTGVFFLLPVIVFAPALWRAGATYAHTTDHRTFWVTAFVVAVFLYLGVSSFWRARRR
jgi:hypothetical protein